MGQTIKVQWPVLTASISGLYVILEAAFTIALLGVLLYNCLCLQVIPIVGHLNFLNNCMTGREKSITHSAID
jgi:hypothetical protein